MHFTKSILIFSTLSIFLYSCQYSTIKGRVWFYTHHSGKDPDADSLFNHASFLKLNPDGSYSRDFGHFDYGTFQVKEKEILLTSSANNSCSLHINYLSGKELQLGLPGGPLEDFEGQSAIITDPKLDPFSKQNNLWRIKPAAKESDRNIKLRLQNHFNFWELYFSWAFEKNIDYIDVRNTPTLLKIYGNGFTLKPYGELPPAWKNCFYDEEDCLKASEMVKAVFQRKDISMPNIKNKYKMFIAAFQQMNQSMQ
jgi:hypothetical protein